MKTYHSHSQDFTRLNFFKTKTLYYIFCLWPKVCQSFQEVLETKENKE